MLRFILGCLFCLAIIPSWMGAQAPLRLSMKRGTTVAYACTMSITQRIPMMQEQMENMSTVHGTMTMTVKDVLKGVHSFDVSYADWQARQTSTGLEGMVDGKETSVMLHDVNAMKATLQVAPDGTMLAQTVVGAAGDASRRVASILAFPILPSQALAIGDVWTFERVDTNRVQDIEGSVVSRTSVRAILTGIRDTLGKRCAVFSLDGSTSTMSGTVVMKNVNVDVSISGDGVGTGLMAIDTKTGMIVINDLITSYQLHMAVSGSQQALIPMEMDVAFSVRAR